MNDDRHADDDWKAVWHIEQAFTYSVLRSKKCGAKAQQCSCQYTASITYQTGGKCLTRVSRQSDSNLGHSCNVRLPNLSYSGRVWLDCWICAARENIFPFPKICIKAFLFFKKKSGKSFRKISTKCVTFKQYFPLLVKSNMVTYEIVCLLSSYAI